MSLLNKTHSQLMELADQYVEAIEDANTMAEILAITSKIEDIHHELELRPRRGVSYKEKLEVAFALEQLTC